MTTTKKRLGKIAFGALSAAVALCSAFTLSACNQGGQSGTGGTDGAGDGQTTLPEERTYTVTFSSEGGYVYGTQQVKEGQKATLPEYTDALGNAITQWYYRYESGATEPWSFAGYTVTEDMTLYAAEADEQPAGTTYTLDASLSAYIDAMGGVEFGEGLYKGSTITDLGDGRYLLGIDTDKSEVVIYTVQCDTFIDPYGTGAKGEGEIENGTIGYYNAEGELVTDGVTYELSAEDDLVNAPDPEGGSNYQKVRYVTHIDMVLENVGPLEELDELELTFYINSQVMGGQFGYGAASDSMHAAVLTISGMTEVEQPPEEEINGIEDARIDEDGHLILTLTGGREIDAGKVTGSDGAQGTGISNIIYSEGTLHIYLTNGDHYQFDLSGAGEQLPDNVTETAASCTQDGVRTTYTDASKTEVAGIRTIERATGHTYADGVCSVCGHSQLDDMTFAESDDGNSYTLTAYESRAWDTVAIPDTCNGKPVAAIADGTTLAGMVLQTGVFMGHTEIERVIVGENLKTVGIGAFSGCTSLESIDLGGVTGLGKWAFQNCSSLAEAALNEGITELADSVFTGCASLEDIALPAGLVSIGSSTFSGCSALQSISLPSGLESIGASAFSGCSSAAGALTIPASLTSMGRGAFSGCSSIEAVTIEAVMDSLPNAAFQNCTSLLTVNSSEEGTYDLSGFTAIDSNVFLGTPVQRVIFDEELASVGGMAFQGCAQLVQLDFGENTAALAFNGQQTFQNCTALEEVSLPANTAKLANYMFDGCTALSSVGLGSAITGIPGNCFRGCTSLASVSVPDSVEKLASGSFDGCTSLESISFGEQTSVTELAGISGCTSLKRLTIPATVTKISSCGSNYCLIEIVNLSSVGLTRGGTDNGMIAMYAETIVTSAPESGYVQSGDYTLYHDGAAGGENWFVTAYGGTAEGGTLTLPESFSVNGGQVTTYGIAARAFYGNGGIVTLNIPSSVTSVGAYAFAGCTSLTAVNFEGESTLAGIGAYAFSGDYRLRDITLPDSLVSIGASAFANCYALKTINIPENVQTIDASAFSGCTLAEVRNLAGAEAANIPAALNVYTAASGQSRLITEGDFTFIYIPAEGEEEPFAALVSYGGSASVVTLPSGFTAQDGQVTSYEIFAGAFAGSQISAGVALSSAVTAIGDYAFYRTQTMRISFSGENNLVSIGEYAFAYSTVWMFNTDTAGLLNLDGIVNIGEYAFNNASRLTSVNIASSVESIAARAFQSSAIESISFAAERGTALTLATYAFAYMSSLESVTVPGYITELPQNLFRGCSALADVVLEEGVQIINNNVFYDCDALESIVLPASMTSTTASWSSYSGISSVYVSGAKEDFGGLKFSSALDVYYLCEEEPITDGMFWHEVGGEPAVWPMV